MVRGQKTLPSPALGRERKTLRGATQIRPCGPLMLLLRGARRGCFHPRSLAVLTCSLPQRAFSRWRVSLAAAVYRLLLRGLHGYPLLYAISRPVSSLRADKILGWGLLPVGGRRPRRPVVGADDPVRPRSPRRRHSHMLTKIRQSGRLHLWSAGALQATAGGFGYTS